MRQLNRVHDTGYTIQGTRCTVQGTQYMVPGAGYRVPQGAAQGAFHGVVYDECTGRRVQGPVNLILDPGRHR